MNDIISTSSGDLFDPSYLLQWYVEMGADECIDDVTLDRFDLPQPVKQGMMAAGTAPVPNRAAQPAMAHTGYGAGPSQGPQSSADRSEASLKATNELVEAACQSSRAAKSIAELQQAVRDFEGCPLKKTAMNAVFADGNPAARVMIIGEAPGDDEDRHGRPFAGAGGLLLDRMLASIGLETTVGDRSQVYMTNLVFWRPPGNRSPSMSEIAVCMPFVERHIELVDPEVIILLGGSVAKAVLGRHEGISKLRGRWFTHATPGLSRPVKVRTIFHPDYLIVTPAKKRTAWIDLLEIKKSLGD